MRLMRALLLLAVIALPTAAIYPFVSESGDKDKTDLPAPVGTRITEFTASDATNGKAWSLADNAREAKAVVVIFTGTECPVNNAYAPRLADLAKKYSDKGVVFVGINSNEQDDAEAIAKHAKNYQIPFPVLKDDNFKI